MKDTPDIPKYRIEFRRTISPSLRHSPSTGLEVRRTRVTFETNKWPCSLRVGRSVTQKVEPLMGNWLGSLLRFTLFHCRMPVKLPIDTFSLLEALKAEKKSEMPVGTAFNVKKRIRIINYKAVVYLHGYALKVLFSVDVDNEL